ncbi:hypothetical protein GPECTOR_1956g997 [Gonium pectorale]|uniref:Uncharacterized protein n=1 Tax=Gonium pectorale TaxID=33097 RepID=A0A150FTA2_GONPE|nr:hypothetical protein GPECTOR_1956g997 [Gonium pectorale]|eukprot:KXZ40842.1 hypothetical protein GPECTOR_1956g997 [Gonium pectorale]
MDPNPDPDATALDERTVRSLMVWCDRGASWWAALAFRKTFVEHRAIAMPLISFGRVLLFQLCWFYILCAWSWGGDDAPRWLWGVALVHYGGTCLLWTLQVVAGWAAWLGGSAAKRGRRGVGRLWALH